MLRRTWGSASRTSWSGPGASKPSTERLSRRRQGLDSGSPEARDLDLRRAEILLDRLGLPAQAAALFREVYEREPECRRVREGLERALRQSNDVAGLCELLEARSAEEQDADSPSTSGSRTGDAPRRDAAPGGGGQAAAHRSRRRRDRGGGRGRASARRTPGAARRVGDRTRPTGGKARPRICRERLRDPTAARDPVSRSPDRSRRRHRAPRGRRRPARRPRRRLAGPGAALPGGGAAAGSPARPGIRARDRTGSGARAGTSLAGRGTLSRSLCRSGAGGASTTRRSSPWTRLTRSPASSWSSNSPSRNATPISPAFSRCGSQPSNPSGRQPAEPTPGSWIASGRRPPCGSASPLCARGPWTTWTEPSRSSRRRQRRATPSPSWPNRWPISTSARIETTT